MKIKRKVLWGMFTPHGRLLAVGKSVPDAERNYLYQHYCREHYPATVLSQIQDDFGRITHSLLPEEGYTIQKIRITCESAPEFLIAADWLEEHGFTEAATALREPSS